MDADRDDVGVGEAVVQVAEDARSFASAQIALCRAMAGARLRIARAGLIGGALAALLALAAINALVVGLILILVPCVGALAATTIAVVGVLAVAAVLGWWAAARIKAAMGPIA